MKLTRPFLLCFVTLLLGARIASAGEEYAIDSERSSVSFGVHHFVGVTKGKFKDCTGTIEIDRQHPEHSSVSASIRVQSIDTGIRKRDDHLCSAEFFDAAKYPQIIFKSRRVKQTGPQAGDISGDLTMHGVTRPVTLHVKLLTPMGDDASMAHSRWAVTTEPLKRSDFNLMFSKTAEAISGIGQEVTINLEIEATKAQ
jgi:polyisoprenoid-binding protein YceI